MGSAVKAVNRKVVEAFYEAYANRDVPRLAPFLDDDVLWTIGGPVDLLRFCGTRRGKMAVLDMIERQVPEVFRIKALVPELLIVEGDRAASLGRLSATRLTDGRVISYRLGQFMRFRNEKIVEYCSVIDSFDAAEQVLGRRIDLTSDKNMLAAAGDLVSL